MDRLTLIDLYALSPLLILLAGALIVLFVETFFSSFARKGSLWLSTGTLIAAFVSAWYAIPTTNVLLTPWLNFDKLSTDFTLLFLGIGVGASFLANAFFKRFEASRGEYYFFLLSAIFGLILIASSADFLTLFLGIETLSLSLYVLCGYMKKWQGSSESSVKYFFMGSLAAAFLLYGIALIYGATGTTNFKELLSTYGTLAGPAKTLFLGGISLVTLALLFEAAIVPFHFWSPDVYQGASNPVTAFMATGTKAGAFAALARVFNESLPNFNPLWNQGVAWLAIPTLIWANLAALKQTKLRCFFAYSGISHAGFLLLPIVAETPDSLSALLFYLVVYVGATLGCFGVLAVIDNTEEGSSLNDLKGLFYSSPTLAMILSFCLLTLGGIPPTAGFFAKLSVFKVAYEAGFVVLVIVALVTTILSAYYYLRLIGIMLTKEGEEPIQILKSKSAKLVAGGAFAFLIVLTFFPNLIAR